MNEKRQLITLLGELTERYESIGRQADLTPEEVSKGEQAVLAHMRWAINELEHPSMPVVRTYEDIEAINASW
jgi:hypothetical protein